MYVGELLPVVVFHDEIGFAFLDGPRLRRPRNRIGVAAGEFLIATEVESRAFLTPQAQ
jgi:hypothetical protein